jgi:Ala-tRNA(Pro) deacylase
VVATKLHELLDQHGIAYERHTHERVVSAQHLAAAEHVSGWQVAKPVLLWIGGELAMAVVPAAAEVDLDKCTELLGHNEVRLATEDEFVATFADSEPGAEPPFGNLYGVPVFVDQSLRTQQRIVCRDGAHTSSITIAVADYERVVDPEIADIIRPAD